VDIADERRSPWRVTGESYSGVVSLVGASKAWSGNENASNDEDNTAYDSGYGGSKANFHTVVKTAL
jgi:hypothetical protein